MEKATTAFPRIPFFSRADSPEKQPEEGTAAPKAIPWEALTDAASIARYAHAADKVLEKKASEVINGLSTEEGKEFLQAAFYLASLHS